MIKLSKSSISYLQKRWHPIDCYCYQKGGRKPIKQSFSTLFINRQSLPNKIKQVECHIQELLSKHQATEHPIDKIAVVAKPRAARQLKDYICNINKKRPITNTLLFTNQSIDAWLTLSKKNITLKNLLKQVTALKSKLAKTTSKQSV